MNCQEFREKLPALIDGEMPAETRTEMEAHLESCEECRAEKHRQEQFTTRVKTSLQDLRPSELFVKGVLDRLDDPAEKKKEEEAAVRRTKVSLLAAGAVIAVVLVAALIHSCSRPGPRGAAKVSGYTPNKAWMSFKGPKQPVPVSVPAGAVLSTDEGGKIVMKLTAGGELTVHEKSRVKMDATPVLEAGAVTSSATISIGRMGIAPAEGGQVQVSLQYGQTVVVKVERGSARIVPAEDRKGWTGAPVECATGETWRVPADKSKPPEKVE
ncbi:MAG: anti-sigma factor family protein [Planctomycetota bacterium]|jgi:hypothetical protein